MKKTVKILLLNLSLVVFSFAQLSLSDSLVAYYPFNGNANDESGNGNDGAIVGATLTEDRFGNPNNAYYFNGIDNFIVIPHSNSLNLDGAQDNYSISLWFKTLGPEQGIGWRILSKWDENIYTHYPFSIQMGHESLVLAMFDTNSPIYIRTDQQWDNEWNHIAMVVNNDKNKLYGFFNNIIIDSTEITYETSIVNSIDIYIGRTFGLNYYFQGFIDDIYIYNRALTEIEIESLYKVQPSIVANFSADTTFGVDSLTVNFSDLSVSPDTLYPVNYWQWDFDNDGTIDSEEQNPSFTYLQSGVYSVNLRVSNALGEFNQITKHDYITIYSRFPRIFSIVDIPNDQGGWVKVNFIKSNFDKDSLILAKTSGSQFYSVELDDGSGWTAAAITAAYGKSHYSVLVPTTMDSTNEHNGTIAFRVIAAMDSGNFVSQVDSGYSVDNLFPAVPEGITAQINNSAIVLNWQANRDADFKYYTIYRSTDGTSFTQMAQTIEHVYADSELDPGEEYYYKISATDHAGNESMSSEVIHASVTDLETTNIPNHYYLQQNYPNPFNPQTTINYGLKEATNAKISIFNSLGALIYKFEFINQHAGHHRVIWDAKNFHGQKVSSGIYYYQLNTANFESIKKMMLIK
jgi:PKD repeat protein